MTIEESFARAVETVRHGEAQLAVMAEQHRVNVRRLLVTLERALAPYLERYLFEAPEMPDSTQGAYLRVLEGMSITSISVIPEMRHPIPAMDFSLPIEDVVRWRFHPESTYRRRFEFADGVLTIHQYTSEDTYLMHELGHLLTVPPERWWHYHDKYGADLVTGGGNVGFNFGFKYPTTYRGVQQLCINEIKADAIEKVLIERYQMLAFVRREPLVVSLAVFCKQRFNHLLPSHGMPLDWLREQSAAAYVTFEDIMARWRELVEEIERRAIVHRAVHQLPRLMP